MTVLKALVERVTALKYLEKYNKLYHGKKSITNSLDLRSAYIAPCYLGIMDAMEVGAKNTSVKRLAKTEESRKQRIKDSFVKLNANGVISCFNPRLHLLRAVLSCGLTGVLLERQVRLFIVAPIIQSVYTLLDYEID